MSKNMITPKTWSEFRSTGLLWWANRTLHLFGWAIVVEIDADGNFTSAYPARVKFRGFDKESDDDGFIRLTDYMQEKAEELNKEVDS